VRDSALLLDATQGAVLGDPYVARPRQRPYVEEVGADPGRLRIGLQLASPIAPSVHADCVAATRHAATLCEAQGHAVEEVAPPPVDAAELYGAMGVVTGASLVNKVQAREKQLGRAVREDELEPRNWEAYGRALGFSAAQHEAARQDVYELGRRIVAHQRDYDLVLSPTVAIPPPPLGVMSLSAPYEGYARAGVATSAFTLQYNFSGQPAMNVPLFWNDAGLPIGAMFAAAPGREDLLFRVAAQLEAAAPWAGRRPALGPQGQPVA
jgi:Asp-tRNA(Asn)/Glu-tRNA(Gln) amidotransferase A subunit family amidase